MRGRHFLVLAVLVATLGACEKQPEPTVHRVKADAYTQILLGSVGAKEVFEVRTRHEGFISPFVQLPPPELTAFHFEATDEAGKTVDLASARPLPAGLYRIVVTANAASSVPFNIAFRTLRFAETEDDSNTAQNPISVSLPFTRQMALRAADEQHWYRLDVPGPGVLLVRLASLSHATSGVFGVGPVVPVAMGANYMPPLLTEVSADGSGVAHRYFEIKEAGAWFVRAGVSSSVPLGGDEGAQRLDIVFYPDKGNEAETATFVALGVSPDDPGIQQIRLRMRAEGKNVIVTNDPKVIAKSLSDVGRKYRPSLFATSGGWWTAVGIAVLVAAAVGYFLWRRRQAPPGRPAA